MAPNGPSASGRFQHLSNYRAKSPVSRLAAQHSASQQIGLFDTIVDRDAAIAVSAQVEPGMLAQLLLYTSDAIQMADVILRNGSFPAHHVMHDRLCGDAERQTHLVTHSGQ